MLTYTDPIERRAAIQKVHEGDYEDSFKGLNQYIKDLDSVRRSRFDHGRRKLVFSVIYSVDGEWDGIRKYIPKGKPWRMTESGKSEYEYNGFRHRKYAAILSSEKFQAFVDDMGISADGTETMGSLGAPGFGYGWAPAIWFSGENEDCLNDAYVTPVVLGRRGKAWEFVEYDWSRMRDAIIRKYEA